MFNRPQSILHATTTTLATLHLSTAQISTTSCHTIRGQCPLHHTPRKRRRYATIAGSDEQSRANGSKSSRPEHAWPEPPKGHSYPTPYQIFAMAPGQAYSKSYFYRLVKLYHPDRCEFSSSHKTLPLHVRIERYRLIVAAHNILSDPTKRSAYDRFGMGWNAEGGPAAARAGPFTQNCADAGDPIWTNATWEDWERFYEKKEAEEQGQTPAQPYYMSNTSFFFLVIAIISAGSTYNMSRAKENGRYFVLQRDIMHDRAAKELRRVKADKESISGRHDRVEWFMRHRDAALGLPGSDPAVIQAEMADRMLPNGEVCRREEIVQDRDR